MPDGLRAFALVPALSLAYFLVVRRHPVARWRIASFALAMLLLLAVFATPLETLALNHLLTAHFLQNVTVAEWAPALLVLSLPPLLARRVHVPMIPALVSGSARTSPGTFPPSTTSRSIPVLVLHVEHPTYLVAGTAPGGR